MGKKTIAETLWVALFALLDWFLYFTSDTALLPFFFFYYTLASFFIVYGFVLFKGIHTYKPIYFLYEMCKLNQADNHTISDQVLFPPSWK